jgi:hypothetical protein
MRGQPPPGHRFARFGDDRASDFGKNKNYHMAVIMWDPALTFPQSSRVTP